MVRLRDLPLRLRRPWRLANLLHVDIKADIVRLGDSMSLLLGPSLASARSMDPLHTKAWVSVRELLISLPLSLPLWPLPGNGSAAWTMISTALVPNALFLSLPVRPPGWVSYMGLVLTPRV